MLALVLSPRGRCQPLNLEISSRSNSLNYCVNVRAEQCGYVLKRRQTPTCDNSVQVIQERLQ